MASLSALPYVGLAAVGAVIYLLLQVGKRDPRMPKGPPTIPILGNAHQIPKTGLYKQLRSWAKEYGSVYTLKLGPANLVVLCDRKAIHKLLVEKGATFSDRPGTYVGQILTKGNHLAIEQMTPTWRDKRKIIAHSFSPKQLDEKHYRIQEAEATVLLTDFLDSPAGFYDHIQRYTASVATTLVYGQRAATADSFWGRGVYNVMNKWTAAMEPGANPPVDEFPFLQYIPSSIAFWKRRAYDARATMEYTWRTARELIEKRRATGERRNCVIDAQLDEFAEKGNFPMSQDCFNYLMGEMVEGGADTTSAQLLTLVLAFALHPWVQEKARKEIDAVCGPDRAPLWDDFEELPYINCIVKEGMRWRPVAVTALPHRAREDTEYEGMFIPKDSTVVIPTWALHHSDHLYKDPESFNPDRYLGHPKLANDYAGSSDYQSRDHYNYGAGRRICPGVHLAERNMWRIAAKLLWAFEFAEPQDPATGTVIPLDPEAYNPGILMAPLPFKVQITPRSRAHTETIRIDRKSAETVLAPYE